MKKNIIRAFATLLISGLGYFTVENYTGQDIILEDGTVIESKELKTNINNQYRDKKTIDSIYVYLHHTVTKRGATIEEVNKIHLDRGWEKLSYHFAVWYNSDIAYVNSIDKLTYHTKGHNEDGIAIAMIGNYEEYYPTKDMEAAVRWLIEDVICKTPNIYVKGIIPHKYAKGASTLCCGKYAIETFSDLFYDEANN